MTDQDDDSKKPDPDDVQKAKLSFIVGVMDMSWRLASIFLLPVALGFVIDTYRDTTNAVVIGTIVGFVLSVIFIVNIGLKANKQ